MYIYLITNKINNKIYIGKTIKSNPYKRWIEHCSDAKRAKLLIHKAIKKYGKTNFTFEIIKYCNNIDELNQEEIYWIEQLKDLPNYNRSIGGEGGASACSAETRLKISLALNGHGVSKETRKAISISCTKHKNILCLNNNTIYKTAKEAADKLGIKYCNICRVLNNTRGSAGGMKFLYVKSSGNEG